MIQKLLAGTISTTGGVHPISLLVYFFPQKTQNKLNNKNTAKIVHLFLQAGIAHRNEKEKSTTAHQPLGHLCLLRPACGTQNLSLRLDEMALQSGTARAQALRFLHLVGLETESVQLHGWKNVPSSTSSIPLERNNMSNLVELSWRGQRWELQFIDIEGHDSDLANPVAASPSRILEIRKLEHKCQKWRSLYIRI